MIKTRSLLLFIGGLWTFAVGIFGNLVAQQIIDPSNFDAVAAVYRALFVTVNVTIWQIFLLAAAATASVIVLNRAIELKQKKATELKAQMAHDRRESEAQIDYRDQTIGTLQRHLHDARQFRFLDVVTGIPNEARWKNDIIQYSAKASIDTPRQVALIDLVDFGRLNDELGYSTVDKILRYLAQSLEESMRKNEGLYKRHLVDNALLPSRLYRKYPGGDEFYVVAEGSEASMIGLLTRLQRLIRTRLDEHISQSIAQSKAPLQILFSGAVCELHRDEEPEALTRRLEDHLRPTRYPDATLRLNWQSGQRSVDFLVGSIEHNLYREAEREFAIARPESRKTPQALPPELPGAPS